MGNTKSPMSIAYELDKKGYDPKTWLNYLDNNREDLQGWQIDQIRKDINIINLKDILLQKLILITIKILFKILQIKIIKMFWLYFNPPNGIFPTHFR